MALNTHGLAPRGAFVTVDGSLHELGSRLTIHYRSDWSDDQLRHPPQAETLPVLEYQGRAAVRIDLPPSGMVFFPNSYASLARGFWKLCRSAFLPKWMHGCPTMMNKFFLFFMTAVAPKIVIN